MDRTACTEPQCLYSTALPLLPLCAVRPVHSLSGCTEQINLYYPYGHYGLYTASVHVQYIYNSTPSMGCTFFTQPQCLYSTAPPPPSQWAVRIVHDLSALQYTYNSTPRMGITAYTQPQFLYSTTIPLLPLWAVRPVNSPSSRTV